METIEDIVREMREHHCCTTAPCSCWVMRKEELIDLLDRIEAAAKATVFTDNTETLHNLLDENARLKAALKPVLECDPVVDMEDERHGIIVVVNAVTAVQSAQRIYNEGGK